MHAGYSDVADGDSHIAAVVEQLRSGPQWQDMLVIVTFDENGGWWDHVAPPKGDRWGPGSRIPAIVISPHARHGHVEHTVYDTGSIARLLTRRFGLEKLPGLAMRERDMRRNAGIRSGRSHGAFGSLSLLNSKNNAAGPLVRLQAADPGTLAPIAMIRR